MKLKCKKKRLKAHCIYCPLENNLLKKSQSFQKTSVEKKAPARFLQTLHVYSTSKQRGKDVFT